MVQNAIIVMDQSLRRRPRRPRTPTRSIMSSGFQRVIAALLILVSLISMESRSWNPLVEGMIQERIVRGHEARSMPTLTSRSASVASDGFGPQQRRKYVGAGDPMSQMRLRLSDSLRRNNFKSGLGLLEEMLEMVQHSDPSDGTLLKRAAIFDDAVQKFTSATFSPPYYNTKRILLGAAALRKQLSSRSLPPPYNTVPKASILAALRALTGVNDKKRRDRGESMYEVTRLAFRFLQRLITGVGVRGAGKPSFIAEKEFCLVLNAYSNCGRMGMAHRVVALQERTSHAPPLSPVAYSILAKGYGRLGDLSQIRLVSEWAFQNGVVPDTIMCNSLIDAYINCDALDQAHDLFQKMKTPSWSADGARRIFPPPNRRTYNTMLKGFGQNGELSAAVSLAKEMETTGLWDAITTNSLVHAASLSGDLDLARELLEKYAIKDQDLPSSRRHPNVEAYTELVDAYAKNGQLEEALLVLQLMRQRKVTPNEVTYTCLISGMARGKRIDQAKKMLAFMKLNGLRPTSVTYNAFISALFCKTEQDVALEAAEFDTLELDSRVDDAMKILREMMSARIRPNTVTISVLVDAMGRCNPARVMEASLLVEKLEREKIVPIADVKVLTALIKALSHSGDIAKAIEVFRRIRKPDVVAINAFLDACCRCKKEAIALATFDFYFRKKRENFCIPPDVISYSTLISSALSSGTVIALRQSRAMYFEMRDKENIVADRVLIDIILKGGLRIAQNTALSKSEVKFLTNVISDAERLQWDNGQLERRKRALRAVLTDQMRGFWSNDGGGSLGSQDAAADDELFKRKGWNKVDSGFQLWGGGGKASAFEQTSPSSSDEFLRSHGWNDVESGFRIL